MRVLVGAKPDDTEGVCDECGDSVPLGQMEIDHRDGIGWDHGSLNQHRRVAKYWREYSAGVRLRATCGPCNASDGIRFRKWRPRRVA